MERVQEGNGRWRRFYAKLKAVSCRIAAPPKWRLWHAEPLENRVLLSSQPFISGPDYAAQESSYTLNLNVNGVAVSYWLINWGDGTSPATAYTFTVVAVDELGNTSAASLPWSAMTQIEEESPSTPLNLSGGTTYTTASLQWNASTDNIGVSGYVVFQNGTLIGTTTNTYYTAVGLTPGTTYQYSVAAFNAVGNDSDQSVAVILTTTPTPTLTASTVSSSEIDLSWTSDPNATGYSLEVSADAGSDWVQIATPLENQTVFDAVNLAASTTYEFQIGVILASGQIVFGTPAIAQTVDPTPTNLVGVVVSGSEIDLRWSDASSSVGFTVLESTDGGDTFSSLGLTPPGVTDFAVLGQLIAGTSYEFEVQTLSVESSTIDGPITVTTPQLPTAPANFVVTPGNGSFNLNWTNESTTATSFIISRSENGGATWQQIAALAGPHTNSWTDLTVTGPSSEIYYQIAAANAIGVSPYVSSGLGNFITGDPIAPAISLNWSIMTIPSAASQINIQDSTDGTNWTTVDTEAVTTLSATIYPQLASNTTYYLRLNAVGSGYSGYSYVQTITTPLFPATPTGLYASVVSGNEVEPYVERFGR